MILNGGRVTPRCDVAVFPRSTEEIKIKMGGPGKKRYFRHLRKVTSWNGRLDRGDFIAPGITGGGSQVAGSIKSQNVGIRLKRSRTGESFALFFVTSWTFRIQAYVCGKNLTCHSSLFTPLRQTSCQNDLISLIDCNSIEVAAISCFAFASSISHPSG